MRLTAVLVAVGVLALSQSPCEAQSGSREFWPELQLHWRFDEANKAIAMVATSRERDSDDAYEAQAGLTMEHRFGNWLFGRIGYRHGWALDDSSFREDRLLTEQIVRLPLPGRLEAELRTREDFRWLDSGFSVRLRERLMLQRTFRSGGYEFTPYLSGEVYYDTRYDRLDRNRLIAGVTLPVVRPLTVEPYYARQTDTYPQTRYVDAFGLVLAASF